MFDENKYGRLVYTPEHREYNVEEVRDIIDNMSMRQVGLQESAFEVMMNAGYDESSVTEGETSTYGINLDTAMNLMNTSLTNFSLAIDREDRRNSTVFLQNKPIKRSILEAALSFIELASDDIDSPVVLWRRFGGRQ